VLPHEIAVIRWQHVDELYNELTQEWTNAPEKSQVPTATDSDITTLTELQSDKSTTIRKEKVSPLMEAKDEMSTMEAMKVVVVTLPWR
jgi:hypothetical protein